MSDKEHDEIKQQWDEIKHQWKESPSRCLLNLVGNIFDIGLDITLIYVLFDLTQSWICGILGCIFVEMAFSAFLLSKSANGIFSNETELEEVSAKYIDLHRIVMAVICISLSLI